MTVAKSLGAALRARDGVDGYCEKCLAEPALEQRRRVGGGQASRKPVGNVERCGTPSIQAASVSGHPFGAGGRHSDLPRVACTARTRPMFQARPCSPTHSSTATC